MKIINEVVFEFSEYSGLCANLEMALRMKSEGIKNGMIESCLKILRGEHINNPNIDCGE